MTLNIADLKQQVEEAAAKFASQLDWSTCTTDESLFNEYLKAIQEMRKEGLVYLSRIVKHKTKRGYSPKRVKCRKLYSTYKSEIVADNEGNIIVNNYIHPLPVVLKKTIVTEVLNEGTKTV